MTDFYSSVRARHAKRDALLHALPAGQAVACLGLDVPVELVAAAGLQPIPLEFDTRHAPAAADRYGNTGHPVLRSLVGELLGGRHQQVRRLIVGSTPRYLTALYTFLMEMRERDADFKRFDLQLLDIARGSSPSALQYNADSLRELRARLEQWSGVHITDDAVCAAIAQQNRVRALLTRLNGLRPYRSDLSGELALQIHSCATLPDCGPFLDAMESWLNGQTSAPRGSVSVPTTQTPRIIYSGTATGTGDDYRSIEAEGLRIVDDDQDLGARAVGPLLDESLPPMSALLAQCLNRHPASAGWAMRERSQYLLRRVTDDQADGVLFAIAAYDHPAGWDYPALCAELDRNGVPHASANPYYYRDTTLLQRAAATLATTLRTRTATVPA
jgi:benzoyl-CoA reductase/2-hydroxyglutaryl-CoA dehydratase subunit BcrC/BadD/HgdB